MKAERWQQIENLFHAAVACGADGRAAYLDDACAGDAALRAEVEALLAAHEEARSFMDTPAFDAAAERIAGEQGKAMLGEKVGHYKILTLLGAGGMGEVWRAAEAFDLSRRADGHGLSGRRLLPGLGRDI